jgi:hypothetical protein
MRQPSPTDVPESTDWERFDNAVKLVLAVPPDAVTKEKNRMKRAAVRRKKARERSGLLHDDGRSLTRIGNHAT